MGEGKNIISFIPFDGFDQLPFGVLEMDLNPTKRRAFLSIDPQPSVREMAYPVPGFGRVTCPC